MNSGMPVPDKASKTEQLGLQAVAPEFDACQRDYAGCALSTTR
jgi:hypothetical protein